jgi:hypothetical protein
VTFVALAALAGLALAQQTDTTIAVQPGTRLTVNNYGGEIIVRSGAENRVRVRAGRPSRTSVEVRASPGVISVRAQGRRGPPQRIDLEITVPRWMPLNLSGVYADITVEGVDAAVSAETVEGDVALTGGNGAVALRSVEGSITVRGARGRVAATSVEGTIHISDASADITAETVDGDIVLERIQSANVDATTVDGDIVYEGTIRDNGRYRLSTHDGDLWIAIPERSNVTVAVSRFQGEFEASFPVQVTETGRRRFQFTLGTGSARLELDTFDGDIQVRRPGEPRGRRHDPRKDRKDHRDKNHDKDDQ